MYSTKHPDQQQLDAYYAGSYQQQPERKQEIASHLEQCPQCAGSLQFGSVLEQSLSRQEQRTQPWLAMQLAQRRLAATEAAATRGSFRLLPVVVPVLATVFAALFVWRSWLPIQPVQTVAPVAQSEVIRYASSQDEMYANIDFYLWLDNQTEDSNASDTLLNPPG